MKVRKRTEFGKYIVADPEICHGQLTFKGTRILVADVLYFLAKGYDWTRVSHEFDDCLSDPAIAEAITLASEALTEKTGNQQRLELTRLPIIFAGFFAIESFAHEFSVWGKSSVSAIVV